MSKKRHSANRTRKQRKKSYVQKHPQSKEGGGSPRVEGNDVPKTLMIILLIIFFIAILIYLIQGGQAGYDWYPNRHRYR